MFKRISPQTLKLQNLTKQQFLQNHGFNIYMVVMIENSANLPMKNPELNVGVLTPPNSFYKPVLYSDKEATDSFNKMDADVRKNAKPFEKQQKTPVCIKLLYWAAGITAAVFGGKKLHTFLKK